jgi:hypothetical protein
VIRQIHPVGVTTSGRARATLGAMNEERIGIALILSVIVWFAIVLVAFFFVGAVVGVLAIAVGIVVFIWWLARIIRSPGADEE